MQKIYCFVDETGQDDISEFFIVVSITTEKDRDFFRIKLTQLEYLLKIGKRKWHKADRERRKQFLNMLVNNKIGAGDVYFGRYKKPLPYFLPMLDVLEKSINNKIKGDYRAVVYIDGIDKKKAIELTNALRLRGVRLTLVRSARDESEPLIRLADRWAGCIRGASLGRKNEKIIFENARKQGYLKSV